MTLEGREGREDVTFPDEPAQAIPSQRVISWLKPPLRGAGTWPFPKSHREQLGAVAVRTPAREEVW